MLAVFAVLAVPVLLGMERSFPRNPGFRNFAAVSGVCVSDANLRPIHGKRAASEGVPEIATRKAKFQGHVRVMQNLGLTKYTCTTGIFVVQQCLPFEPIPAYWRQRICTGGEFLQLAADLHGENAGEDGGRGGGGRRKREELGEK